MPQGSARAAFHGSVGETLLAAVIFAVAMGVTWMSSWRDSGGSDELALSADGVVVGLDDDESDLPLSQPAVAVSFGRGGEIIRPAPETARIVDPETGEEVLVPLPPGATVVDGEIIGPDGTPVPPPSGPGSTARPGSTGTTRGTGTSSTTSSSTTSSSTSSTTSSSTTSSSTTTSSTTSSTTTTTSTSVPDTTPPTDPPPPAGALDGLLGDVVDLLG